MINIYRCYQCHAPTDYDTMYQQGVMYEDSSDHLCWYCDKCSKQKLCPAQCEHGKVPIYPLGYITCTVCQGHGYIKKDVKQIANKENK